MICKLYKPIINFKTFINKDHFEFDDINISKQLTQGRAHKAVTVSGTNKKQLKKRFATSKRLNDFEAKMGRGSSVYTKLLLK